MELPDDGLEIFNFENFETINLKIKSNGTPLGTFITDDQGRVVENIKDVTWFMSSVERPYAKVTLIIMDAEIEGVFEITREVYKMGEIKYDTPFETPPGPED